MMIMKPVRIIKGHSRLHEVEGRQMNCPTPHLHPPLPKYRAHRLLLFFQLNIGGMTLLNELTCPIQSFYADQLDFEDCLPKAMDFCLVLVNVEC